MQKEHKKDESLSAFALSKKLKVCFLKINLLFVHMAAYLYSIAWADFIWPIKFDKVKSEIKDISVFLKISLASAQWLEKLNSDTFMLRKIDCWTFYGILLAMAISSTFVSSQLQFLSWQCFILHASLWKTKAAKSLLGTFQKLLDGIKTKAAPWLLDKGIHYGE